MNREAIESYARARGLSPQDASQTFMQVVVLKNLSLAGVRLIGGTALVLGHGNPRFSEDVDLTQVPDQRLLKPGLIKAAGEIGKWFGKEATVTPPKAGGRTWRITCRLGRSEALRLHVDCQEYPAYSVYPIVVQFPSVPSFVFEAVGLEEIMAEKVIALAFRRYLGGRDLFDLWFHWLRFDDWISKLPEIRRLIGFKLKDRSLAREEFARRLEKRLSPGISLDRARAEWRRYLSSDFQKESVGQAVLESCRRLPGIFS